MSEAISAKLSREAALVGGLKETFGDGVRQAIDDCWKHPEKAVTLVAGSAILGTAIAAAARNPFIAGETLMPALRYGSQNMGKIGAAFMVADLGGRISGPMADAWQDGQHLEDDKRWLGQSLGSAMVDYSLMSAGGAAGMKYGLGAMRASTELLPMPTETNFAWAAEGNIGSRPYFDSSETGSHLLFAKALSQAGSAKPPKIALTGKVSFMEAEPRVVAGAEAGDIFLYPKLSSSDNYYVAGRVFDGSKMRAFDLIDIVGSKRVFYTGEQGLKANVSSITVRLQQLEGEALAWRRTPHNDTGFASWPQYRLKNGVEIRASVTEAAPSTSGQDIADRIAKAPVIELTGRVHSGRFAPSSPEPGDIHISSASDQSGKFNRAHGHTNFGFSGYFKGRLFDGQAWKPLDLWSIVGEEHARFSFRYEIPEQEQWLIAELQKLQGKTASMRLGEGAQLPRYGV